MITDTTKLTFDTDSGRTNSSPSLVVAGGRRVIFYEKFFTSGLTAYSPVGSHISTTPPLTINVPAGNGTLNGSPVSWSSNSSVLPIDSFVIVYVDAGGIIHYDTLWTMGTIAISIVLAYVNVGHTAIVSVEEVEKTGKYIYVRKQELSGGNWVWAGEENIVNTGEQPKAFYDLSLNKIFLSYKKDSVVYVRVFDLSTELTWRYLPNIQISSGTINMNHNPEIALSFFTAAGSKSIGAITDLEIYPMSVTGLSFIKVGANFEPHIFLPFLTSPNINFQYLVYPYYVEICSKSGAVYTVEESIAFSNNGEFSNERWHQWVGSLGIKYIRIRAQCPVLIRGDVVTPEDSYRQVEIFDPFEKRTGELETTINSLIIDERLEVVSSAGMKSLLTKTYEYEEKRDFEEDTLSVKSAAGMKSLLTKIYEYEETRDFEEDTLSVKSASGMKSIMVITNTSYP